ncbi:MAG: hypothetical protein M3Z04_21355, partial [Chloroflexota bacterium]|nr:hypothetical protein [Chloroflexota bacterium]
MRINRPSKEQAVQRLRAWRKWIIVLGLAGLMLPTPVGHAAMTSVVQLLWATIAGGGGSSAGAGFIVGGTIGQPAPGPMQGGALALHSGYWGVPGTPYAPPPPPTTPTPAPPGSIAPGQVPKVDGSLTVWENNPTGLWNIFGKDLSTGQLITVTNALVDQRRPAVSKDLVVWQGQQSGNWDIYGARISGGTVGTAFPIYVGPGDQTNPAVSNNVVVWQSQAPGSSRADIMGEDLTSARLFTLTTAATTNQNPALDLTVLLNTPPYRNILTGTVVWQSTVPTTTQRLPSATDHWAIIAARSITSTNPVVFTVTDNLLAHTNPAISGNMVVWQEYISPTWRLAGANLVAPITLFPITTDSGDSQVNPAIS